MIDENYNKYHLEPQFMIICFSMFITSILISFRLYKSTYIIDSLFMWLNNNMAEEIQSIYIF